MINVHDKGEHWRKKNPSKFRNLIYWSNQIKDIFFYINGCLKCAKHDFFFRFQLLHIIKMLYFFQLLNMNYIETLFKITNNNFFTLHIFDYFTRHFFIYVCSFVTSKNIIRNVNIFFVFYELFKVFYIDYETHFDVDKIRNFFKSRGVVFDNNSSNFSKNTEIIKMNNHFLEQVLKKQNTKWDLILTSFIQQLNFKVIKYFHIFFLEMFLKIFSELKSIDFTLTFVFEQIIQF